MVVITKCNPDVCIQLNNWLFRGGDCKRMAFRSSSAGNSTKWEPFVLFSYFRTNDFFCAIHAAIHPIYLILINKLGISIDVFYSFRMKLVVILILSLIHNAFLTSNLAMLLLLHNKGDTFKHVADFFLNQ